MSWKSTSRAAGAKRTDDAACSRHECGALRDVAAGARTTSIDVIVSNCVLNLVQAGLRRRQLFAEMFRVLKRRRAVRDQRHRLRRRRAATRCRTIRNCGPAASAARFARTSSSKTFEHAGFYGMRIVERAERPWQTVDGIEFRSVTVVAYKGKQGPCLEHNQAVIYRARGNRWSTTTATRWSAGSGWRCATRRSTSCTTSPGRMREQYDRCRADRAGPT